VEKSLKKILVGITGASGSVYAYCFLKELKELDIPSEVIITKAGEYVLKKELGFSLGNLKNLCLKVYTEEEFYAPPASGSSNYSAMVVIPCSMGTVGAIASGISRNLLQRAADVMLKEKKPLVLVVRETPLNVIHLKNLLTCAEAGATVFPASPAFYQKPKNLEELINFFVQRLSFFLGLRDNLSNHWQP